MTLRAAQRSPSLCHSHTDADRSSTLVTTPANPYVLAGSCAGRSSSTIWCWSPRSMRWVSVRPDMLPVQVVAELAAEQVFGVEAVLDHGRRGPLRGDHRVVVEVPPHVVGEKLIAAIGLPCAGHVEGVVVEQCHAAWAVVAVGAAQRGHEDALRAAVQRVRPGVPGLGRQLFCADLPDHRRRPRIRPGIEDVGPRGSGGDPRRAQVADRGGLSDWPVSSSKTIQPPRAAAVLLPGARSPFSPSMAPSSRSMARRAPVWHDQPRRRSRYQIPGTVLASRTSRRPGPGRGPASTAGGPPGGSGPASSAVSSSASCASSSRHRAACPLDASPATPAACRPGATVVPTAR